MHSDQDQHRNSGNGHEQDLELVWVCETEHGPLLCSMSAGYRPAFSSQFRWNP